jgi:hypothetical protein
MADVLSLSVNSTVSETLGEYGDYYDATSGYYYDFYQLTNLAPGYGVTIDLASNNFDTYVGIYNASSGQFVGFNNDGGAGTNSSFTFTPTLGDQSSYYAVVSSNGVNSTGNYQISAYYS